MDIEGLGEKLVEQLIGKKLVRTVDELYELGASDLVDLDRMAEISSDKVIAAIQKSRKTTLARFIYALGIPEVGETTARDLARFFGGIRRIMDAKQRTLQYVKDVGPEVSKSITQFFTDPRNLEVVNALLEKIEFEPVVGTEGQKHVAFSDFIQWLKVPDVRKKKAEDLASFFGGIGRLKMAGKMDILKVPGITDPVAESIQKYFSNTENLAVIDQLEDAGLKIEANVEEPEKRSGVGGKIFVMTGTLVSMSRDQAKDRLEAMGATVSESVSKKTNYVVVGEGPGSKADKAMKLGVPILTEQEFLQLLEKTATSD